MAADADLVWRRAFDDGSCAEVGLKLGVLTLANRNGVVPVPLVGLLCGYRF